MDASTIFHSKSKFLDANLQGFWSGLCTSSSHKLHTPSSQNKWLNWPWALFQNKWLLCFIALIQVVSLDQQGWNHNVMWEEVALPTPICVFLNVALYSCFLHTLSSSQSCNIAGSKNIVAPLIWKWCYINCLLCQKKFKIDAMSLLLFCRIQWYEMHPSILKIGLKF
jgi:hypothetical protein